MIQLLSLITILIIVILDQSSKKIALNNIPSGKVVKLKNYIKFTIVKNSGAAFGLLKKKSGFLKILVTLILVALIYYYIFIIYDIATFYIKVGFVMVISGAIGNLIDRYVYGYVIDFIYFKFRKSPVFNIADISIFAGSIIIIIGFIKINII